MARLSRKVVVRVACALIVIRLCFTTLNPWRQKAKLNAPSSLSLGDARDVLSYVNIFIGTKNGGKSLDQWRCNVLTA